MIGQVALMTFFAGLFLGAIWGECLAEKRLRKKKKCSSCSGSGSTISYGLTDDPKFNCPVCKGNIWL